MVATQLTIDWIKWRRRTRLDLILRLPLRGTQKTVMMRLADYLGENEAEATAANDSRRWCWPSVAKLALACGRSDRAVQLAIEQLAAAGLIEKAVRFQRDTGRQTSNHYRIGWNEVGRMTEAAPMSCWNRPLPNRTAKTSPPRCNHFTPPVKSQNENFTPPVKPLHPLNGIETQERQIPPSDRKAPLDAARQTDGRRTMFGTWFDAETLRIAIRRREATTLRRAFDELGDAAKFAAPVPSDAFVLFVAMAYDANRAAKTSPVGLLSARLGRCEVTRECVTSEGVRWANATIDPNAVTTPVTKTSQTGVGRAGGCRICQATENPDPTGCAACNSSKRVGMPVRGL